jgi:hypothetical protein
MILPKARRNLFAWRSNIGKIASGVILQKFKA